jgi:hypothetical protein
VGIGTGGCASASLAAAALISETMNCCADSSWRRVSNDTRIALCFAAASSASTSIGRPM